MPVKFWHTIVRFGFFQNFVTFSEYKNFTTVLLTYELHMSGQSNVNDFFCDEREVRTALQY